MSPGCCAVDALSQDWQGENNWLCPLVSMIVDVIRHARACLSVGTLIVPEWPSAFFWPLLKPQPSSFASFVTEVVSLPKMSDLIIPGPGQEVFYSGKPTVFFGCPKFSMLALRINFRSESLITVYSQCLARGQRVSCCGYRAVCLAAYAFCSSCYTELVSSYSTCVQLELFSCG